MPIENLGRNPEPRRPGDIIAKYEVLALETSDRVLPKDAILAPVGYRDPFRPETQMYGKNGGTSNPHSGGVRFTGQRLQELGYTGFQIKRKDEPDVEVLQLGPNSMVTYAEMEHAVFLKAENSKNVLQIRLEEIESCGFVLADRPQAAGASIHRWIDEGDDVLMGKAAVYVTGRNHEPPPKSFMEETLSISVYDHESPLAPRDKKEERAVEVKGPWNVVQHYLRRGYIIPSDRIMDLDAVQSARENTVYQTQAA
jgi:hypothetical protein